MDRGLLIALMTLQQDFVTRGQFMEAFQVWLSDRSQKLDDILILQGAITKNQRERLATKLLAAQARSHGDWQSVVSENVAIRSVYDDMLSIARNDTIVLPMVKLIGEAINSATSQTTSGGNIALRFDPQGSIDPNATIDLHATLLHDGALDPYATLNGADFDDLK